MKNTLFKTLWLATIFFSAIRINSQTAGTSSLSPIEITDSIAHLTGQKPDDSQKWYKIIPWDENVAIRIKVTSQGVNNSFVTTRLFVVDEQGDLTGTYKDTLSPDNAVEFTFSNFPVGSTLYLLQSFSNTSCENCTAPQTLFDLDIYQGRATACPAGIVACNLLRNPSFEDFTPPTTTVFPACYWSLPNGCTNNPVGSSDVWLGHTGNNGVGLYIYGLSSYPSSTNPSYREYIQSQLLSGLVPGKMYQVSMWVSRYIDGSFPIPNKYCKDLSVFFSATPPCQNQYYNNINTASYTGQKIDMSPVVITNMNYQKYVVNFVANNSYNYITIGNFLDNSSSTILPIPGTTQGYYVGSYVTIDDVSILTPTVSLSSPVLLSCPVNTFQFNPTSCELDNTTYVYSWFPSTGLSNPNILNPIVNVTSPIVYTLTQTGTNSFGTIVNTATVSVIYPYGFNVSASSSSPVICKNYSQNSTTLTAGNNFGTCVWQPGNLSGASQVVSPTVTTIYTVTATYGPCAFTSTTVVYISNSCCDVSGVTKFNGTNISSNVAYTSPLVFNNDITVVPGGQLTLANAEYLFAPNVKITVAPNAQLTIRDAHLYACGTAMWNGIVVQSGGRVLCTTGISKDNLIEDAITAIDASNQTNNNLSSILNITNTTFNKNYVDINISNYNNATANYPFIFSKCVFTCRNLPFNSNAWPKTGTTNNATNNTADLRYATASTAGLAGPFLGQGFAIINLKSPYSSQTSQTAIQLTNVGLQNVTNVSYGITIGDGSQTLNYNLFDAHNNFIYAINSNVNSFNNTFQNTRLVAGSTSGSAIKTTNNYTNASIITSKLDLVSPTSPNLNFNRFYDCHTGIEARNQSTLNVKYARMSSTQSVLNSAASTNPGYYGIFIESNRFNNYQVHNSQFSNLNTGIYCSATTAYLSATAYGQSWGTFSVTANLFCPAATTAAAVGNGFVNTGIIVENILGSRSVGVPSFIAFSPYNGLRIQYNNFYKVWNGIYINSFNTSAFPKYIGNNVVNLMQQGNGSINQRGINISNNIQSSVRTNTVTGVTTNTNFPVAGVYNSLNASSDVQCNYVSTLPRGFEFAGGNTGMAWKGNTMVNNGRGMQATNWGTSASSGGIGAQGASNSPSDNFWQGGWNSNSNLQTYTDANTNAANSKIYARNGSGYVLNQSWNNGQVTTSSYFNPINRPAASSSTFVSCGAPAPREGREWHDIADEDSEDESAEINQYLLFINLDMDSLLAANDDTLETFYEANVPEEVGQLNEIEKTLALGLYEEADGMIAGFEPETNIQSNFKKFFRLYHTYRTTDTLITSDSTDLFILANQCPFKDGPAIYKARALYNLIYANVVDYNDEGCEEEGYSGRMAHTEDSTETKSLNNLLTANESKNIIKKVKTDYKIYPNPAAGAIYIKSKKENEQIHVIISDMCGRQLLNTFISVNAYQSNLELNLLNGVYTISLINTKNERITKKLIISQ